MRTFKDYYNLYSYLGQKGYGNQLAETIELCKKGIDSNKTIFAQTMVLDWWNSKDIKQPTIKGNTIPYFILWNIKQEIKRFNK